RRGAWRAPLERDPDAADDGDALVRERLRLALREAELELDEGAEPRERHPPHHRSPHVLEPALRAPIELARDELVEHGAADVLARDADLGEGREVGAFRPVLVAVP